MGVSLAALTSAPEVRIGWRTNVPPAWEFDVAAITNAARKLGVKGPIRIGCTEARRGRFDGLYMPEPNGHRISVWRRASAANASSIIWHELAHAAQEERGDHASTMQLRGAAYTNDPSEVEARDVEARFGHIPLVKVRA